MTPYAQIHITHMRFDMLLTYPLFPNPYQIFENNGFALSFCRNRNIHCWLHVHTQNTTHQLCTAWHRRHSWLTPPHHKPNPFKSKDQPRGPWLIFWFVSLVFFVNFSMASSALFAAASWAVKLSCQPASFSRCPGLSNHENETSIWISLWWTICTSRCPWLLSLLGSGPPPPWWGLSNYPQHK